jgi:hypothetical protein
MKISQVQVALAYQPHYSEGRNQELQFKASPTQEKGWQSGSSGRTPA